MVVTSTTCKRWVRSAFFQLDTESDFVGEQMQHLQFFETRLGTSDDLIKRRSVRWILHVELFIELLRHGEPIGVA